MDATIDINKKEYYNNEFKQEYIDSRRETCLTIEQETSATFGKIKEYEEKLQKDCSCFTVAEIMEFYCSLQTTSLNFLTVTNSRLTIYTNYALEHGRVPDGQNHYFEFTKELMLRCVNTRLAAMQIIARSDLLALLPSLENEFEKFLLLALFEGLYNPYCTDLFMVEPKDITCPAGEHGESYIALASGRQFPISNELAHFIRTSAEEYECVCYSRENGEPSERLVEFDPADPHSLKMRKSGKVIPLDEVDDVRKHQRVAARLARIREFLDLECIRMKSLNESGRIHFIRQKMLADSISVREAIRKYDAEITLRFGQIRGTGRYLAKYGEFYKDLDQNYNTSGV